MELAKQINETQNSAKKQSIKENQSEMKASDLSSAEMNKEEKDRIRNISKNAEGSLKYSAGSDVDNKLKSMANLDIRKKFKTALAEYINIRKTVTKNVKGKDGVPVMTGSQKAEMAAAYEVLKVVIEEYLSKNADTSVYGTARKNLDMVKRTNELIKIDNRIFRLNEYSKSQLEPRDEKKESDSLPKLIDQVNKEKQEEKKEDQEKQKKEDDKKAADRKEEEMSLEEKRGIYNYEEKTKHVKALMDKKIPVPESNDELVQIRSKYSKSINVIKKDGTAGESYEWDENKVDPVMKEHYDWLYKYYYYNDPTIEVFRKELKPVPAIEFKNYKNQMDIKGMEKVYEAQDPSNCYCCSGTALINQYIAMRKKRNGEKDAAITQVVNQHQMRAYKPRIRKYDKSFDLIMDKEGYDNNALSIDEYAGAGKTEFGNIFALGDFVLETLKDNGIEDVMLNRMVMNVPQDGMAAEFNTRVRDNMKAVFAEKINEIISAGGIASVLTVEGGYAHYITVTGIDGDNLQVYNSSGYANKSTTESISSLLQGGVTVEINWLSDMKEPKELTEEYKNLQYDEVNGYSFKTLSSHQINESVSHTKGVTVIKDFKEMGDAYMDISQMAYIPDKKQVESYDFDTYINQAKEEKKQWDKEQVKKDGWEIVDSTVTESKDKEKKADSTAAVSKEKEEKAENKAGEKKVKEKKEWTPIANEVLANDQRDYKFKKTEFPKWNFTSISANKEDLMGKEKLDELIGPDVIAKTAEEYLAKSANSDYVEKYVKNYPQIKELDSLIDETYSKALPGKKISSKVHKEVTKDVRKKLAMQRHLLVENQELLKRRNEERALIQNNLKKEGPRSDYTVDIANNFKTDSEKAALGVWLVGGTYSGDKTRTGKQDIFECNIADTQFDMKCIVEEADLTEFDYNSDSEFIADYAKKYEKLTKLSLVDVFLDKIKYSVRFSKTYLRKKCELAKAIKEEYEERFKLISSPYYALIPQKDLKKYLGKDGEAKIADIKDKELADYLMLYRSDSNKKALKKTAKYFNSVINRAMEIQKGKDAELSGKPISRIKQGQELAAKLKKNNSALTDNKEENLRLIYKQQIELAKSDEPEKDGDFIEKIALEKEMTLFLGSEGEALHNFEKKIAGFLKNGIYGVPLKEEHKKGLKEQLDKCFKARREYVRHKKAKDIVDELSWSFGCDMVNKKFAETKEGKFLKQFANEGDVPVDMDIEVRNLRNDYEQTIFAVFRYLHENGYPMSQDSKYEKRIDNEKLVKEQLEYFCIRTAKELKVPNYKFPEITINGKKFVAYSTRAVNYEQNWKPKNVLYYMAKQADKFTFEGENSDRIMEILGQLEKVNKDMVVTACMYGDGGLEKSAVHDIFMREKLDQRYVLESELIHLLTGKVKGIETLETNAMKAAVERAEEKKKGKKDSKGENKGEDKKEDENVEEKKKTNTEPIGDGWTVIQDIDVTNKSKQGEKAQKNGEKEKEKDKEIDKAKEFNDELLKIGAAKSDMLNAYIKDPKFVGNKIYYGSGSNHSRYYKRQVNLINYFHPMSDKEAKKMYSELMVNTGMEKVTVKQKNAKAKQYEKVFDLLRDFDLKKFDIKSPKDFLDPAKKDTLVLAGAILDFQTGLIEEYKEMIKDKKVKCAYNAEQFKEIEAKWEFVHVGFSWASGIYDLDKLEKECKNVDVNAVLKMSVDEIGELTAKTKDPQELNLYSRLIMIKNSMDTINYGWADCEAEKLFEDYRIKKGLKPKAVNAGKPEAEKNGEQRNEQKKEEISAGWQDLETEAAELKNKEKENKTAEKNKENDKEKNKEKNKEKKPVEMTAKEKAEKKAREKFEKDLSAVISKGNKALSKGSLTAMRNNYGLKLEQAATLDLILGVNVRKKEAYEKQLAGIKKLIAASRPKYDQNKKLVNQVLTQFAKLGATERTLDAKSADLNMVRKGIQACAAYIRNILTDEPVLPEDAVYISQTFKSEVPVTDGKGNAIDMNRPIYMIRHKKVAEKNKKVSSAARLLQRETEDMNFNNIGKYSQLSVTYNNKLKDSWKVSSSIRDIVPILLPLEGNGEIPEEEMKKFAQGQDMILTGRNKETDKKATKEELLDAFNDFLPYFRDRVKELADYKARFSKLCSNNVSYTDIFKMAGNDVRLLMGISQKAQAMGYAVRRILKNPVLMEIIPEDTLKEILDGWNALSPLQGVFGEPISSHYNNICAMTPNELISNGYDGWKTFKTYDERFAEQKVSHEKEFRLARKKADRKDAEKKKAEEEAARKDKRKGSKKKEDKK